MPTARRGNQGFARLPETPSRTSGARRESAKRTYERFAPGTNPDRVLSSLERRMGALGTFVFDVVGDMWDRPQLTRRDRSLAVVSVLAAQTRDEELVAHTRIGLRHGLTHAEITEVLLHVAMCAGFPAALASARQVDQAFREESGDAIPAREPAESKDDDRRDTDMQAMSAQLGWASAHSVGSALDELVYRWSLGEVWSRSELDPRDRCLVTIAILAAMSEDDQLEIAVLTGLNNGLTREDVEELLTHLGLYFGLPRSVSAMGVAKRVNEAWEGDI